MLSWVDLKSWRFLFQKVVDYQLTGNATSVISDEYKTIEKVSLRAVHIED